jgi:FkbM family methyltransferase
MAFENVRNILRIGSPLSSFKLLLIAASRSRPKYRTLCLMLLRPFTTKGEILLRYRCYDQYRQCFIGLSDLESDLLSFLELGARDTYDLDLNFHPDLVIDGGGNIGLFTLRASAAAESIGDREVKFVVCEPLPRNVEQIRKHLAINKLQGEIVTACLGGERRTIPFYCREAISSSFDPGIPYDSVIDIPVHTMQDLVAGHSSARILIKLDIEGMEIEVLSSFVPAEQRPVYIVGELHSFDVNAPLLRRIFADQGWTLEFREIANDHATFCACSPAALPLLPSMSAASEAATIPV